MVCVSKHGISLLEYLTHNPVDGDGSMSVDTASRNIQGMKPPHLPNNQRQVASKGGHRAVKVL
eukprot:4549299-Amphidinium_carterae.1